MDMKKTMQPFLLVWSRMIADQKTRIARIANVLTDAALANDDIQSYLAHPRRSCPKQKEWSAPGDFRPGISGMIRRFRGKERSDNWFDLVCPAYVG